MKTINAALLSAILLTLSTFANPKVDATDTDQSSPKLKVKTLQIEIGPKFMKLCKSNQLEWTWNLKYFSRDHQAFEAQLDFSWRDGRLQLEAMDHDSSKVRVEIFEKTAQMFFGPNDVPRQLALPHLRERILGTPLVLDDLRSIYRFVSNCEAEFKVDMAFFKDSMIAYSNVKPVEDFEESQPDLQKKYSNRWKQYNYRWKQWKKWHFKSWLRTPIWEKKFPQIIEFTGQGEEWGRLELVKLRVNSQKVAIPQP